NLGAGKLDRVTKIVRITLVIGISAAIVFSGIALAFPKQIFTAFSSEAEVQGMAFLYMGSLAVSFLSFALMAPYNAVLNGLGHASLGLFIGIMDGVVARIGLSLLLGVTFKMGVMGFWYGNAFAGYVTVIIGAAYYYSGRWRKRKLLIQN
ncbi:MAG: MATE family efflux transporter, partial [Clostridiales bacterium]|nr:MATE family efflux transporter [Clostridiales bacterium]